MVWETRNSSPCSAKMARFRCLRACWASFVAVWPGKGCCWANFVAVWPRRGCCWASFVARERLEGPAGRVFRGFAWKGLMLGELCRGWVGQVGVDGVMCAACYVGALVCSFRAESARNSSPCRVKWFGKREKVRPARQKWLDFGVFGLAGRVFSRFGQDGAVAGRVFSRGNGWRGLRGEFCLGLAVGGVLLGEFCLARALASSLVNRPERRQHPTQATAKAGDATRPHAATPPAA